MALPGISVMPVFPTRGRPLRQPIAHLSVDDRDEDVVWVHAEARLCAEHSDDLWTTLEWALHEADGRAVVLDLSRVTEADAAVITTLTAVARKAQSWRRELLALFDGSGIVGQHFAAGALTQLVSMYESKEQLSAVLGAPNL